MEMPRRRTTGWWTLLCIVGIARWRTGIADSSLEAVAARGSSGRRLLAGQGGCSLEPLQVLHPGLYATVGNGNRTFKSCADFTGGSCPIAVPFPNVPCMVNCVATEAECVEYNRHTPGVNPFVDPHLCASCSITACKACEYPKELKGAPICKECFVGFTGSGGEDGRWQQCDLWDAGAVTAIMSSFAGLLTLGTLFILVATAVGGCRMCAKRTRRAQEADIAYANSMANANSIREPLLDDGLDPMQHVLHPTNYRINCLAIKQGLEFSVKSSIKRSSFFRLVRKYRSNRISLTRLICRGLLDKDTDLSDMGIGLFLFFNTQKFLIVVAFITWMVAREQQTPSSDYEKLVSEIVTHKCPSTPMDVIGTLVHESPHIAYAQSYREASLGLWLVLLFLSWGFYYYQRNFISEYDRSNQTAEDYTLRLLNLPPHITSERALQDLLEKEFRMEGKIHGVCICYNLLELPEETHTRIEEMIEHITEYDTLQNGWATEETCTQNLQERLAEDAEDFKELLQDGKLRCSGEAYVVFEKQADMVKVQDERCGIRMTAFHFGCDDGSVINDDDDGNVDMAGRLSYAMDPAVAKASKEEKGETDSDNAQFVEITPTQAEPSGLRFYEFATPEEISSWNNNVKMPIRMIIYIGLYSIVAQLFYSSMIRPWQDNLIEGAEGSGAVNLIGKIVVAFNFAIQTMVMIDVERFGKFKYLADVDQRTFLWNTLLLVITNLYLIMQECYRAGMRWDLTPPDHTKDPQAWWEWRRTWFQSTKVEGEVAERLAGLMTEQIMMLYIIGEVANVLAPVIFYWFALRAIFVWNLGGDNSKVQKVLRSILPAHGGTEELPRVTARLAERAQILVPLLLWMEYTYIVVFAWMAFFTFFLATDEGSTVCGLLFGFSVIFYIWQRYVMLWGYGKATYDTEGSYEAFSRVWGCVISFLPPISVWWTYRLGDIQEKTFAYVVMAMIFALACLVYLYGLWAIEWFIGSRYGGVDQFDGGKDPGYTQVMEKQSYSWWNLNPIYVLKTRHCPDQPGYEVHMPEVQQYLWPKHQHRKGFFELGKEFRHEEKTRWEAKNSMTSPIGASRTAVLGDDSSESGSEMSGSEEWQA
mmetsp:Transcript_99442/g.287029  ORF Transcript_99442/g.287029 Transcript_99442/m.287029 type:complete len:1098 (+) Transcript_99442:85-3378(+)